MLGRIDKSVWWVVMGLFLFVAFALKITCSSHLQSERLLHSSGETFIPIVAKLHKFSEREQVDYDTDSNGHTTRRSYTVYDVIYQYEVGGKVYYMTINGKSSLDNNAYFYCDPKNPNKTSQFQTYDEARSGYDIFLRTGDVFLVLAVMIAIIAIYRTFIYKAPEDIDGIVVRDDFPSFDSESDFDNTSTQERNLNDYGIVTSNNFDYISTVNAKHYSIPESGEKSDVNKVETIPFPGKSSQKETITLYTEEEYNDLMRQ